MAAGNAAEDQDDHLRARQERCLDVAPHLRRRRQRGLILARLIRRWGSRWTCRRALDRWQRRQVRTHQPESAITVSPRSRPRPSSPKPPPPTPRHPVTGSWAASDRTAGVLRLPVLPADTAQRFAAHSYLPLPGLVPPVGLGRLRTEPAPLEAEARRRDFAMKYMGGSPRHMTTIGGSALAAESRFIGDRYRRPGVPVPSWTSPAPYRDGRPLLRLPPGLCTTSRAPTAIAWSRHSPTAQGWLSGSLERVLDQVARTLAVDRGRLQAVRAATPASMSSAYRGV